MTIAVLACLGAIVSTYLGYVGRLLGTVTGIPVAGQALTGLHTFWFVLMLALVKKKGSALLGATLDAVVEFLMGSHIGVWVLPVGILEGLLAEIGFWPFRRIGLFPAMVVAGGLGSISHLFIMPFVLHRFAPLVLLLGLGAVAFVSGLFWAGVFPYVTVGFLRRSGVVSLSSGSGAEG